MLNRNKFKGAVVSAGTTQKELAKELGISPNTLSNKVSGKSCFNTHQIERICDILGITDSKEKADIFLGSSSQ